MSRRDVSEYRKRYGHPVSRSVNRPTFQRGVEYAPADFRSWWNGVSVFPELVGVAPVAPVEGRARCCPGHPDGRVVVGGVSFPGFGVFTAAGTTACGGGPAQVTCGSTLDPRFTAAIQSCEWGLPGLLGHLGAGVAGEVMHTFARRVLGAMAATIYAVHPEWCGGESPGMDGMLQWWDFDANGVAVECVGFDLDMREVIV